MMNKELPKFNLKVSNKMYYIINNQCSIIICRSTVICLHLIIKQVKTNKYDFLHNKICIEYYPLTISINLSCNFISCHCIRIKM